MKLLLTVGTSGSKLIHRTDLIRTPNGFIERTRLVPRKVVMHRIAGRWLPVVLK